MIGEGGPAEKKARGVCSDTGAGMGQWGKEMGGKKGGWGSGPLCF